MKRKPYRARRFTSAFLAGIFVFMSSLVTAFPTERSDVDLLDSFSTIDSAIVDYYEKTLDDEKNIVIKAWEYANGDTKMVLEKNDCTISAAHIDKSEGQISGVTYDGNEAVSYSHSMPASETQTATPRYSTYGPYYEGKIGYRVYSQGYPTGTNSLEMYRYVGSGTEPTYRFLQQYKDFLDMVSWLIGIYSIATSTGVALAEAVFDMLDQSPDALDVIVYYMVVSATYIQVDWRADNEHNTSMSARISGVRYTFNLNDVHHSLNRTCVAQEGYYYPKTAFTDHNVSLARTCFNLVFPHIDTYDVISWTS